jgi:hypothetical protein
MHVSLLAHVVPHFSHPILLGLPFIISTPVDIIPSLNVIRIGSHTFPLSVDYNEDTHIPVRLSLPVRIPAHHQIIAEANIQTHAKEVVIENIYTMSHTAAVTVGNTLSPVKKGKTLIHLMNDTDNEVTLKEGIKVADASVTMLESRFSDALPDVDAKAPAWEQVVQQFDTSTSLTPDERQQLFSLLSEFKDIVSHHSFDLGRTSLLKHSIDTGDAAPVKCRPYRHSHTEQRELDRMITAFLREGVIRESNSPWSSPVILVKKKDGTYRM